MRKVFILNLIQNLYRVIGMQTVKMAFDEASAIDSEKYIKAANTELEDYIKRRIIHN